MELLLGILIGVSLFWPLGWIGVIIVLVVMIQGFLNEPPPPRKWSRWL